MTDIVFADLEFEHLCNELTRGVSESCAVLFASHVTTPENRERLLVRAADFPSDDDYVRRAPDGAELSSAYIARVSKHAKQGHSSIVFVHSHPGLTPPSFSRVDDEGEHRLAEFLRVRCPNVTHASLVISGGGVAARKLGTSERIRVVTVGIEFRVRSTTIGNDDGTLEVFDRQVRAFGREGQSRITALRIGIVGLGGVGSLVSQMLVHLGIRKFLLIDPDVVEESNLNRVVNASGTSVGQSKVDVAARYISSFSE
ncbi:MAG TPA: ThiF family adenylyltransferase, partial [Rhizomicrobium sp.]